MKILLTLIVLLPLSLSCQREEISITETANDTFYLDNLANGMRINVRGNTASKVIMVIGHGGPGGGAATYRENAFKQRIEPAYAVAYWDQRLAGASQGTTPPKQTIAQHGDDLKKVVLLLKHRYGQDTKIWVHAQSWGGIVSSEFLTTGTNQRLVQGWIFSTAAFSFPVQDSLIKRMIVEVGSQEIAKNKSVNRWKPMVDYCQANLTIPVNLEQSLKLNRYGFEAMTIVKDDGYVAEYSDRYLYTDLVFKDDFPITAYYLSLLNPVRNSFAIIDPALVDFRGKVERIDVPTLIIAGKYDFVTPPQMGLDLFHRIASRTKRYVLLERSTHNLEEQDLQAQAIGQFIEENR